MLTSGSDYSLVQQFSFLDTIFYYLFLYFNIESNIACQLEVWLWLCKFSVS